MEYKTVSCKGHPIIMGTISCLADTTQFLEDRVKMHERQLRFLEQVTATMAQKYGEEPIPYFRVEQGWNDERREKLATTLPLTSIPYEKPIPPGAARNQLLKILYESDADWLICMDDDHAIYEKYDGYELLWELSQPQFLKLAQAGYMIMTFPAYWDGYAKEVDAWGHASTDWLLKRTKHPGAMPFACIPNVVKYGKPPVFFDEETAASRAGEIPEDLKFMLDWIINGGQWVECMMMVGKSCGDMNKSSIFTDKTTRVDKAQADRLWATQYLKQRYPRNPQLWTLTNFLKRRNPTTSLSVPRKYRKEN